MKELNYPETTKWVVAHNNLDYFISNKVESQNCFSTGQPYMEVFDTEEEAKEKFPQAFPTNSSYSDTEYQEPNTV